MSGAFTYLGTSLDAALNVFVVSSVSSVAATLRMPALLAMTCSVMLRGYTLLRGLRSFLVVDAALDLAFQALLIGIALSSGLYMSNVVAVVSASSDTLISIFAPGASNGYQALDQIEVQAASIANRYISLGISAFPTGGYIDLLTGMAMGLVIATLLIILGGYFLVAKVALSLVLCVGPLFIAACAFKPTRHWFSNWLNKVFNYVLLMALMTAALGLVTSIYGGYLNHLMLVSDATNPASDCIDLILLSGAIMVLSLQMPRLAAALTSGAQLSLGSLFIVLRAAQAPPPARASLVQPTPSPGASS